MTETGKSVGTVLAEMLVENTGRHMMDSGGTGGRLWERNQAKVAAAQQTPEDFFRSRPETVIDEHCGVTLDLWHYLNDRLIDYVPALDHAFRLWVYTGADRYTNGQFSVADFVQALANKGYVTKDENRGHRDYTGGYTGVESLDYTYNCDNRLSQDFLWVSFMATGEAEWLPEGEYVFIAIHNGADARGGFTDYRPFYFGDTDFDGLHSLLDFDRYMFDFECDGCGARVRGEVTGYDEGYAEMANGDAIPLPKHGTRVIDVSYNDSGKDEVADYTTLVCTRCGKTVPYQSYPYPAG